jgi:hypothetical protein
LTVLVFKDNDAARVFKVPMRWILQFGWLLGALLAAAVITLSVSAYLATHLQFLKKNPASAVSFSTYPAETQKIAELQQQVKTLEQRLAASPSAALSPEPIISPELEANATPGTPLVTPPFLFNGLPDQIQAPAADIPISITAPKARWEGKTLKVRFGVQYTGQSGSQQGRIIILARGPGTVLAHPNRSFYGTGHKALIDPNQGEYFSVSRYRATNADFGPIASRDSIESVEVIILGQNGQLLIHQMLIPDGKHPAAAPAPAQPEATSTDGSSGESGDAPQAAAATPAQPNAAATKGSNP